MSPTNSLSATSFIHASYGHPLIFREAAGSCIPSLHSLSLPGAMPMPRNAFAHQGIITLCCIPASLKLHKKGQRPHDLQRRLPPPPTPREHPFHPDAHCEGHSMATAAMYMSLSAVVASRAGGLNMSPVWGCVGIHSNPICMPLLCVLLAGPFQTVFAISNQPSSKDCQTPDSGVKKNVAQQAAVAVNQMAQPEPLLAWSSQTQPIHRRIFTKLFARVSELASG